MQAAEENSSQSMINSHMEAVNGLKKRVKVEIEETFVQLNENWANEDQSNQIISNLCFDIVHYAFRVFEDDQEYAQKLRANIFKCLFPENEKKDLIAQMKDIKIG